MTLEGTTEPAAPQLKLKVPQQVARIIREATIEERMQAARGEIPLAARDLLTTLFFLVHGSQSDIRTAALATSKRLSAAVLQQVLADPELHPRLLDFLARARMADSEAMAMIIRHHALPVETLQYLAGHAPPVILRLLGSDEALLRRHPQVRTLLAANAQVQQQVEPAPQSSDEPPPDEEKAASGAENAEQEGASAEEDAEEEVNLSKYQQALEMNVSAKIKMALTGDKEWRAIFLKDANKLVSSAVMKNPRITEGEVLAVAKSKTSSEELIRLITLNPDWMKNSQIQKALVTQPRTPLPKALRFMAILSEKELKVLATSRGVSQVIVNTARRMLQAKLQKK